MLKDKSDENTVHQWWDFFSTVTQSNPSLVLTSSLFPLSLTHQFFEHAATEMHTTSTSIGQELMSLVSPIATPILSDNILDWVLQFTCTFSSPLSFPLSSLTVAQPKVALVNGTVNEMLNKIVNHGSHAKLGLTVMKALRNLESYHEEFVELKVMHRLLVALGVCTVKKVGNEILAMLKKLPVSFFFVKDSEVASGSSGTKLMDIDMALQINKWVDRVSGTSSRRVFAMLTLIFASHCRRQTDIVVISGNEVRVENTGGWAQGVPQCAQERREHRHYSQSARAASR